MNIQLGNLSLEDVIEEEYLGKITSHLESNGYKKTSVCEDVKKQAGNYHIYDIPRLFVICGKEKMNDFIKFLKDNNLVGKAFKTQLGLTYIDISN